MPELPSWQHCVSVNYACTFFQITSGGGLVVFAVPSPVQFTFLFETGRTQPDPQLDLYEYTWDYSWFDQAQVEQQIGAALDGISADIATLLGVSRSVVEQSVSVSRVWTVAANQQGAAAPRQFGQVAITEIMLYPVQITGADVAVSLEESSVSPA